MTYFLYINSMCQALSLYALAIYFDGYRFRRLSLPITGQGKKEKLASSPTMTGGNGSAVGSGGAGASGSERDLEADDAKMPTDAENGVMVVVVGSSAKAKPPSTGTTVEMRTVTSSSRGDSMA